jgi:5'(3')-deoxyribonucleotidase
MNAVSENITEDESAKPLVFLDMDGVLADFFGDWSKISGVSHYKDIGNVEQALQLVRDHPTFWIDLPLLPNARALVKTVIEKYGEYRICSTPLAGDGRSKPGKIAWINKHFADMPPAEVVLTHNKAERAQHNGVASILVDDFGSNIDKWKAAGGIGIKYEDSAFPKVATILTSIAKSGVPK